MPQTKTKQPKPAEGDKAQRRGAEDYERAAAAEAQPEPLKPTARQLRQNEAQRQLDALQEFIGEFKDMSRIEFEALKTFKLILDRNYGCTTPIEDFIVSLVHDYEAFDAEGRGLTLKCIVSEVENLVQADMPEEVRRAHLMASRYPLPEAEAEHSSSQ